MVAFDNIGIQYDKLNYQIMSCKIPTWVMRISTFQCYKIGLNFR